VRSGLTAARDRVPTWIKALAKLVAMVTAHDVDQGTPPDQQPALAELTLQLRKQWLHQSIPLQKYIKEFT
jgi:hypothetical protein